MPSGSAVISTSLRRTQRKKTPNKLRRFHMILSFIGFLVYHFIQNVYSALKIFFVFFTEHTALILRLVPKKFYPLLLYPIVDEIVSTTTRVIFTRRKQNRQGICLKLWQFENTSNNVLVTWNINYLLEGYEFNKRFAPFVYLGIAPVYFGQSFNQPKNILRGKLIEKPKEQDIKSGVKYVIVMRRLDEHLRLDQQIYNQSLYRQAEFKFLAKEIARMHKKLVNSPIDRGTPYSILSKLEINRRLFEESLQRLNEESKRLCIHAQDCNFIDQYGWISNIMAIAYAKCIGLFQQRYDSHCIKRCHGDLKTQNLWIQPESSYLFGLIKQPRQFFPIDCIDFNPEFCHIDTLSDLAMLVIDLERHFLTDLLKVKTGSSKKEQEGTSLIRYFLDCYLCEMAEDGEKWDPLLEYYMTEKSMVCAYVSILYDERPLIGKKYLEVAYIHAQRLEKKC